MIVIITLLCFTQTFEATSWEMSINFSVDFESDRAANAKTKFQIYYLAQLPSLGDLKTFAHEIYDDTVQGFVCLVSIVLDIRGSCDLPSD